MAALKDEYLIELYLSSGSEQALNLLCQRYWNDVYRFIEWKYGISSEKSKDITQDIFLSLNLKLENHYVEQGHFRSWLFRVVNNYMVDYIRKDKQSPFLADCDIESLPVFCSETPAEKRERKFEVMSRVVTEIVEALPSDKRNLIELKYKEHKSFQEIADMYGLKKSTCVKRIRMICQKLHEELVCRGFDELPDEE